MLRLTIALLVWVLSYSAAAADADGLFQKGLGDYQAKKFDLAKDDFTQALSAEPANARVMHNLALTYYQLNQRAEAVAYWRKAVSVDPSYRPARLGRELMESKMNMRPFERDPAELWQQRALERVGLVPLGWAMAVITALTGALWLRYLIRRRGFLDRDETVPALPLGAIAASLVFVLGLVSVGLKLNQVLTPRATVIGEKVSARSLPADEGVALFEVTGGTEVLVRHVQGEWDQVENPEGSTGWVKRADLVPSIEG